MERVPMRSLASIALVAAVWGGYHAYSQHQEAAAMRDVLASADASGFVDVPPPLNQESDTIYVVAAQNCPHEAAQRADHLAKQLQAKGLPVVRTNQVGFRPQQVDKATMKRLNVVMNGPLPLVFSHSRIAMNPDLDQVVSEYNHPGPSGTPR
jgi:hypothetical protein